MSSEDHLIVELHEGARIQIHLARWSQLQIKVGLGSCMVDLKVHGERQQVFTMQSHQRRHPLTITIPDFLRGKARSNATSLHDWAATQHGRLTSHQAPWKPGQIHRGHSQTLAIWRPTWLRFQHHHQTETSDHTGRTKWIPQGSQVVAGAWDLRYLLMGPYPQRKAEGSSIATSVRSCPCLSMKVTRAPSASLAIDSVAGASLLLGLFFWLFTGQLAAKCPFWPHRRHCRAAWARCCGCAGFIGGLSYLYMLALPPFGLPCPSCP